MKWMRLLVLTAAMALCASAADITGTWKAVIRGPQEQKPKTVSAMTFDLKADETKLTGKAHVGNVWDSIMAYGEPGPSQEWQVAGKKSPPDAH